MPLSAGQVLNNHYRVVKKLAQGGFGTVYRAWDIKLNGPCALKENLDNAPDARIQFEREATMLAQLGHPNLPKVRDHFVIPEGQFMVMDFIEGEDLETKRLQSSGALSEAQVLIWMDQVCEALAYLHAQNPQVIHRDIKPANIRITSHGKAVLVDFGIAKQQSSGRTKTGARGVSEGYSPPEQYAGIGTTARSDIYALGATIYTLLTGIVLPESIQRVIAQGGTAPAVVNPPHMVRPGISPLVSRAVMRAIHPDSAKRFGTVREFQLMLHGQPAGQITGRPPVTSQQSGPFVPPSVQQTGRRGGAPSVVIPKPPPGNARSGQSVSPLMQGKVQPTSKAAQKRDPLLWLGIGLAALAFIALIAAGIYFAGQYTVSLNRSKSTAISGPTIGGSVDPGTATVLAGAAATPLTPSSTSGSTSAQPTTIPSVTNQAGETPSGSGAVATGTPGAPPPTPDPNSFNGVIVTTEPSSTSGIRIEILYANNTPKTNCWVAIHKQTVDVSNNPLAGERVADQYTDKSGAVIFELPPDTYTIELSNYAGYPWGNPFNYIVQSGKMTIVRVTLGMLTIGLRNADGQPLTGHWVGIYIQDKDMLGNPVKGERIADGYTNDAGSVGFHLSPGLYTVEIHNLYGEVWGDEMNHAILPGQPQQILVTTGKLQVGVVNADGQPVENIWVGVHFQRSDVSGNPVMGDRFADGYTNNTGAVVWDITKGVYGVTISGLRGYPWGNPLNHVVAEGQTTKLLVELGRLAIGLKDANGSPVANKWIGVYIQRKDASGNITKGDRCADGYTDSAGLAQLNLTPGDYTIEIGNEKTTMNVSIVARHTTITDGNTQEVR